MTGHKKIQAGITLLELMIVVTIIGIIAAIAYPSYQRYVDQTRRTDGQAALMETAQRLERCFSMNGTYQNCVNFPLTSEEGFYQVNQSALTQTTFTLQAVPQGPQAGDNCGTMTLQHTGRRDAAANDCW